MFCTKGGSPSKARLRPDADGQATTMRYASSFLDYLAYSESGLISVGFFPLPFVASLFKH